MKTVNQSVTIAAPAIEKETLGLSSVYDTQTIDAVRRETALNALLSGNNTEYVGINNLNPNGKVDYGTTQLQTPISVTDQKASPNPDTPKVRDEQPTKDQNTANEASNTRSASTTPKPAMKEQKVFDPGLSGYLQIFARAAQGQSVRAGDFVKTIEVPVDSSIPEETAPEKKSTEASQTEAPKTNIAPIDDDDIRYSLIAGAETK